jgi:hypothetical protein
MATIVILCIGMSLECAALDANVEIKRLGCLTE